MLVKFTENPRKSSDNLLEIRGYPEEFQEIRGNPLEIRGSPVEFQAIRGDPRKSWISWQSGVQILAELLPLGYGLDYDA